MENEVDQLADRIRVNADAVALLLWRAGFRLADLCGNEYRAGGIPYSCKREAGHTGNHTDLGGDFRWMNEG